MSIDRVEFFRGLATEMNAHPQRFGPLGEADMDCLLVMQKPDGSAFTVRLVFEGIRCEHAVGAEADDPAEFKLIGPIAAWEAMFADIETNGKATGFQTINSLALMGDDIYCGGDDPMGLDKFSRFNQTLQEFFDGASRTMIMEASR